MEIGSNDVNFFGNLSHRAKFIEHKLFSFGSLTVEFGHILRILGCGIVGAIIFYDMRVEAVEERFESRVFGSLWDTRDLSSFRLVVALSEVFCNLHASVFLFCAGTYSLPDIDLVVKFEDVRVGIFKMSSGKRSGSDFGRDHGAGRIANVPEFVLHALVFGACRRLIRSCGLDGSWAASNCFPESGLASLVNFLNKINSSLGLAIVLLDSLSDLASLSSFEHVGLRAEPAVKLKTKVKNEAVTLVERLSTQGRYEYTGVSLSLDLQKTGFIDLGFNMLESTLNTSFEIEKTSFEVAHEKVCLVLLFFQVMSGTHIKVTRQLH